MSVRVRLTRVGSKKNPIWRVVVADQRSPRDGRFIETVGRYNPQTDPSTIVLDEERLQHWIARGAQPTGTVKQLMKAHAKGIQPAAATTAPADSPEPQAQPDPEAPAADPEAEPVAVEASEAPVPDPAADETSAPEAGVPSPEAAEAQPDAAEAQPDAAEAQPDADSQ
jgi:small subunit ribosomal protein S16